MRIICQQTILMKNHALIVIFEEKKQQNLKLSSAANYSKIVMVTDASCDHVVYTWSKNVHLAASNKIVYTVIMNTMWV